MMTSAIRRLRTAVVGCGKVAVTHATAWRRLPASELAAVCDVAPERARALASRFGVRAYTDLAEMLDKERVEVLSVCTQHTQHVPPIETAAPRGVHVIVEKPLAVDLPSCNRAIAATRAAGVKLGVVSQRRFYEPVRRMREAIDAGKISRPVLASVVMLGWRDPTYYTSDPWRGTWKGEGGGVAVNQAPHYLDLMNWFMGPARELYAYWDNYNHPSIKVDDTVVAVVRFESGAMGSIILSNSQRPGLYGKIHVHGSSGASVGAETDSGSPFISGVTEKMAPPFNDLWTVPGEEQLLPVWNQEDRSRPWDTMTHYHELQLGEFLSAVTESQEPSVNGEAGRVVVELFTAIYQSQRDGKPVQLPLRPGV
jgi:UDP-N-acetyl-2-amino-2-deoxyglucuronate dehydrogenase